SAWWERDVAFFDTIHSRAWIMVRRIAHTAHHRAEQTTLLRLLGREVHSVYGPSVDTGGLPINNAATIYAYPDIPSLIDGEPRGGARAALRVRGQPPSPERLDRSLGLSFSPFPVYVARSVVFPAPGVFGAGCSLRLG